LHLRSGLPRHLILEQHGNSHKEICSVCEKEFYRQFDVGKTVMNSRQHYTGRLCDFCGGKLQDTIVHFSENFRGEYISPMSMHHATKADVAIVMGTSMNVQPFAAYPDKVLKHPKGKLIIVNLQKTPYDLLATERIFMKTDEFMQMLVEELEIKHFKYGPDVKETWDTEEEATKKKKEGEGEEEGEGGYWGARAIGVAGAVMTGIAASGYYIFGKK